MTSTDTNTDPAAVRHFDISQLPSLIQDGMSASEEADKRRKTCRFIEEAGRILKLPRVAVSTSMVFFHRFYAKHAFSQHDRFEVAVASLILAAKTEESPKKVNLIVEDCYKLKLRGMQQAGGRTPPGGGSSGSSSLDPKGEEFLKLKERILLLERVLLHTIGFELSIDHPYKFWGDIVKRLVDGRKLEFIQPLNVSASEIRAQLMNQIGQWAMNLTNDSMQTTLCLQFDPEQIAISVVYLAIQIVKVRPKEQQTRLVDLLGQPDVAIMSSIGLQIMELISDRRGGSNAETTALFAKVRQSLEALKSEKEKDSSPPTAKRQKV